MMTKPNFLSLGILRMARGSLVCWPILMLLTLLMAGNLLAQERTVQGRVTAVDGQSLEGVSVRVRGTETATLTGTDGRFTLPARSGATLTFSNVGYKTQEYVLGNALTVDIIMQADDIAVEEVVVVGYGTQRREAVTGSVASISGERMNEVPASNISQALQGRVAGVQIMQSSSKPGAPMQIRIRGTRSLNASNDPLIVLDGIPFAGSISDINPIDIKSVDILKDASATAIYGSRGANGVMLVTTHKGYTGQQTRVSFNSFTGLKTLFGRYPMMNAEEFIKLRETAGRFQNGADESNDIDTDWQDLLYKNGIMTSQDLSISGGTEKTAYNFSTGYFRDEAVLPGQNFERFSLRGSLDQKVGSLLRLGLTTNNNYSINRGGNLGLYSTLSSTPIANPYNEDGSWKDVVRLSNDNQWVYSRERIENLGNRWIDQTKGFGSYNTFFGEVNIPGIEGLKYRVNVGLNFRTTNGGSYTGEGIFSADPTTPSNATISNSLNTQWTIENLLTYDRTFADKHNINVVGLYSAEQVMFNSSQVRALHIPADQFQFYNLGHATGEITVDPNNQGYYKTGLMSWMGRVMYDYDGRYMLSVTARADGSSRLAPGHKWHAYPAISAGWNVKNEAFMENVNWLDALKLRVGYGQTSNQSVDPYKTLGLLSTRPYNFGREFAIGYYVSELPNAALGWEYTTTWNYGLDFSVFNSRLRGTVEYYTQHTKDLLLSVGLPSTAGVGSYMANVGETQNKGFELSLDGLILNSENGWSWEAGVNFYLNRNKLLALSSGRLRDEANWWFVGHPIDVIYDYERVGLWQEGDPHLDILEPGGNVGMIKVKYTGEFNADGTPVRQINAEDRQIINTNPNFEGGFNTRVSYKGFDLGMVAAYRNGGVLISSLYSSSGYLNLLSGRRNNVKVDYWTPENTNAKYPKPGGIESNDNPKYGSTLGYFDASYLKVRTITLGYNFRNDGWLKQRGISGLRLYGTVQNPFVLFSPYHRESGMDPEPNSYGNENQAVTTSFQERMLIIGTNTPANRNYMIGLNLTF
ncbi:TonB-linked SusC/RagA family outer membrane protein [Sphingobacterium allocomposti]|uniref:TonB-linked SusC/RagA family outer membrane protein n=2 Tax=Sphingobacterium allocomposti TaxID=415956 RepID=A0A5S5DMS1_9SPHI|nr:TonB-linked SusC/RagA family outer membrane protein [Sphingobacterium composti Yoo et al. 2007 non Ten et al. 2007]